MVDKGGVLHQIASWPVDAEACSVTDASYGTISDIKKENDHITFRFAPNDLGLKEVTALQIETESRYYQSNVFVSDYEFTIHARYLRGVTMDLTVAHNASLNWVEPGKVTVSADNGWLPSDIGKNVDDFVYAGEYAAVVNVEGKIYSRSTFAVENRGSGSATLSVPLDKDFSIDVTRNTLTSFKLGGTAMTQNLKENATTTEYFHNSVSALTAQYNQVNNTMQLKWSTDILANTGEWKIYRTELDEHGNYYGNRELLATTSATEFADNGSRGLTVGKYYRYEIYHHASSWSEITIPASPEPLTAVYATEVRTSTVPVVPLHLVQDSDATDRIKMDWTFGNIPKTENDLIFKVHRIEPDGGISRNYLTVTVPRSSGKASFSDEKPESACSVYGYFLQLDLADNKVHLYSDTVYAHVQEGTTVTRVDASKGTAGNSVVVKWRAKQVGTALTLFDVQRRFVGGSEWLTISEQEGNGTSYSYVDETVEPGRYYDYRVVAYSASCGEVSRVISNAVGDVGYAQSTGVVSGRVQFETGTAVDDVRVTLSRETDEQMRAPYHSRYIIDDDGGLVWQTDTATAKTLLSLDKPFTMQMWINPDDNVTGAYLFSIEDHDGHPVKHTDGYSVRLRSSAKGYSLTINATAGGEHVLEQYLEAPGIKSGEYNHVTVRNNGKGQMDVIINGDVEHKQSASVPFGQFEFSPSGGNQVKAVFASGSYYKDLEGYPDVYYKGYIDEVRFWNRSLSDSEVTGNYNRILSGREDGLKLYWTFDEGLEEYAFDSSMTNGVPNGNHAVVGNASRPSEIVPTVEQLSSYGITNDKGEYEIRGIPFIGSGTRYSVYPSKDIHSFSPTSRSAFIGGTSLNINNADFTDVSSFKVRGTIRYSGTTIPVDSVSFYIDGTPCNKNDKMIMTDVNGEYEISVPIGSHCIEARRAGHTFEGEGRYPSIEEDTYEFLEDTHIDFYDNTLVTLGGRITGGATEGGKPLGYGSSENTIGQAVIKLSALDHPQRMMNAVKSVDGTTTQWLPNSEDVEIAGASSAIKSNAYRAGGNIDEARYIYITTDAATGEFSALLPPLRYKVESVKFEKNSALENDEIFLNVPAVNLTNPRDSVIPDTLFTADKKPMPLFKCNKKLMLTYRSNPVLDITQLGMPIGAFGTDTIVVKDQQTDVKLPIFSYDEETRKVDYFFKYPIFQKGRNYEFKVRAYEPYVNYDNETPRHYNDMLRDSVVTFANEIGDAAYISAADQDVQGATLRRGDLVKLESEQVLLDEHGEGRYIWTAGVPSLTAPYTRNMNATMVINGQTRLWQKQGLDAIIVGVVPTGNNFITAGPSYVQMVLRDPPRRRLERHMDHRHTQERIHLYHPRPTPGHRSGRGLARLDGD